MKTYFWIARSCKNALNGAIPEPAAAINIGVAGSKGGLKAFVDLMVARNCDPGVRWERYEVAVPRKSPRPDRWGWAIIEIVMEHWVVSFIGDEEIEYCLFSDYIDGKT